MDEQNLRNEDAIEESIEESLPVIEEEDEGVIICIDDNDPGPDAEELEKSVLAEISARESHVEDYIPPKLGFFKWLENFWYRNKVLIIVAVASVFALAYLIITSIPGKFDFTAVLYVSYTDFPSTTQNYIREDLQSCGEDWDENGEVAMRLNQFDISDEGNFASAAYYGIVIDHLNGEPESMLLVVDEDLYAMILNAYGEELFESYEGAPLWIEITWIEELTAMQERGESPRLGICLLKLTEKHMKDEELCKSYEVSKLFLDNLLKAHPEILGQ